jgi:shikimate kinase
MRKLDKTLVLVGMMGAGKTSVGRRLAGALGVPFRDADVEIEAAAGCTINEIFERFGEPAFRNGERKVIARLLSNPPHVLAAGGGAFIDEETRQRIKDNAISIWLRAPVELLMQRVLRKDTRPLLRNADSRTTLERLLQEREPIYAQADIVIQSDEGPHDVVVRRIVAALEDRAERAGAGARA